LFAVYLVSSYFSFWVETIWGLYGFLYLPIGIASSIILFGTNLRGVLDIIIRTVSAIILMAGLCYAYISVFSSGEQGSVGILFIGAPALFLIFLVYVVLWLIQRFKKA
jgi:hypothetical protein